MNRNETLSAMSKSWQELKDVISQVPDERLEERSVGGPWSVKDLIGHVTTWEQEAIQALRSYLNEGDSHALAAWPEDIDGFNDVAVEGKRGIDLSSLRRELEDCHEQIMELVTALEEEEFQKGEVSERIRIDTYYHYADHAGQIRRWLEGAE